MEAMPQEWTEGRLDELSSKVDRGFEQGESNIQGLRVEMKAEFATVRGEMKEMRGELRGEIKGLRGEMGTEFTALRGEMSEGTKGLRTEMERVNDRIDSVQRTIAFGAVALTGAILAGFAAICTLLAAML